MNIFRFIRAMLSWTSRKLLPSQLHPWTIISKIRTRLETWAGRLETSADKLKMEKPTVSRRPWWLTVLYVLGFFAVLAVLWWLNSALDMDKVLRSPWPTLHRFWLPILFVLGCVLYMLGRWLWRLLAPDKMESDFPDIDAAWEEGVAAMRQAGITPTHAPIFLVLGRPHSSTRQMFEASQIIFPVRHIPRRPEAPLHVTATLDAIFVTCEGASLLGKQADLLTEDLHGGEASPAPKPEPDPLRPPVLEYEHETPEAAQPQADTETAQVLLLADEPSGQAMSLRKTRVPLTKNTEEVTRCNARLAHLCRLIVQRRAPYCPINGVLIVLPLASTSGVDDASQTGAICQQDLATMRTVMQVHCPIYVLLADMEIVPGFCDLLDQFPDAKQRQYVLGQPFPLMPDLDKAELQRTIGRGVEWLFDTLFPTNVYRLLRVETPGTSERGEVLRANSRLFELLVQMRERQRRIHHMLTRGVASIVEGPLLFGGCFLAATGAEPKREQAFVNGVLRLLIDNQNYVSWTQEALSEERDYRRWTTIGYMVIMIVLGIAVAMAYLYWPRQ